MIANGKVVTLSYLLTNPEGEELDRADQDSPFVYLHGQGQIVPGLEKSLAGMKTGDKKKIVVQPQEAYGEVVEDLILKVSRSQFPQEADIEVGMEFSTDVGNGHQMSFIVTDIDGEEVELNGNHPLAGMVLHFDVEIHGVRDATQEEISHGHAHGPGGHEH